MYHVRVGAIRLQAPPSWANRKTWQTTQLSDAILDPRNRHTGPQRVPRGPDVLTYILHEGSVILSDYLVSSAIAPSADYTTAALNPVGERGCPAESSPRKICKPRV